MKIPTLAVIIALMMVSLVAAEVIIQAGEKAPAPSLPVITKDNSQQIIDSKLADTDIKIKTTQEDCATLQPGDKTREECKSEPNWVQNYSCDYVQIDTYNSAGQKNGSILKEYNCVAGYVK